MENLYMIIDRADLNTGAVLTHEDIRFHRMSDEELEWLLDMNDEAIVIDCKGLPNHIKNNKFPRLKGD